MSWAKKRLDDVADFCLGKMLDQKKNKGEPLPYLANVNVRWGTFDLKNLRQMRFEPNETDRYGLKYGDIVMCEGGEPGRCAIWKEYMPGMMIQKALHRIRPHNCLDNRFLFYSFLHKGKTGGFAPLFTGSTIRHLPRQNLAKVEINIPPLPIQQRIASILSAYDDLIENNRRRIQLLEQATRLLYKEWFVHLRFPGHEHVSITDGVPEGWEAVRLQDITSVVTKGTTPTSLGKAFTDEGINFIKVESVEENGGLLDSKFAHIDESTHNLLRRSQLYEGDILFSIAGAIGRSALVPARMLPANTNQALAIIRVRNPELRVFLFLTVRSAQFQNYSLGRVVQTAQKNVSLTALKEARVIMPNKTIMVAFLQQAGELQSMLWTLREQNNKLVNARDLLLPRLMNGEVAV